MNEGPSCLIIKLSAFEQPRIAQFLNPFTAAGRASLEAMVTRQAQIISYIDDYTADDRDACCDPAADRL
jgi:hypothetical protein